MLRSQSLLFPISFSRKAGPSGKFSDSSVQAQRTRPPLEFLHSEGIAPRRGGRLDELFAVRTGQAAKYPGMNFCLTRTSTAAIIEVGKQINLQDTGGNEMRLVDAVYARIVELANQADQSFYKVARDGCIPYSTIATMRRSRTVKLSTLYGICEGLNTTLRDFFDSPLFAKKNITD